MKKLFSLIRLLLLAISPDRKFHQATPQIFDEIDEVLPPLTGKVGGHEVELIIARSIANQIGSPATRKQVNSIISLYSPVMAAAKAFKQES